MGNIESKVNTGVVSVVTDIQGVEAFTARERHCCNRFRPLHQCAGSFRDGTGRSVSSRMCH